MDDKATRKKDLVTWIEELGQAIISKAQSLDMTEAEYTALRWVFDNMEHVEAGENENLTELTATIIYVSMGIIHNHKEALNKLYNDAFRMTFVQKLTSDDLKQCGIMPQLLDSIDPLISFEDLLHVLGMDGAVMLVESKDKKRTYRTKAKAEADGAITQMPKRLPIITQPHFLEALGPQTRRDTVAYLSVLKVQLEELDAKGKSEAELNNIIDRTMIYNRSNLDLLTPLKYYYGLFLEEFKRRGGQMQPGTNKAIGSIKVSASVITGIPNPTQRDILKAVDTLNAYSNLTGVVRSMYGKYSLYQVLTFEGYNADTNTFEIKSPYTDYIINRIYNESYKRKPKNNEIIIEHGQPVTRPSHSYVIDASIQRERDKSAIETVFILVRLIEASGAGTPNKKVSAIIAENPILSDRYDKDRAHRARNLKRHFENVWRLMKEQTHLTEKYKNLKVSTSRQDEGILLKDLDPTDKRFIPSAKTAKTMCFYFYHDGKNKAYREKEPLS